MGARRFTDSSSPATSAVEVGSRIAFDGFARRTRGADMEISFVKYQGDKRPRAYRGEHTTVTWRVEAVFSGHSDTAGERTPEKVRGLLDILEGSYEAEYTKLAGLFFWPRLEPHSSQLYCHLRSDYTHEVTPVSGIHRVGFSLVEIHGGS